MTWDDDFDDARFASAAERPGEGEEADTPAIEPDDAVPDQPSPSEGSHPAAPEPSRVIEEKGRDEDAD